MWKKGRQVKVVYIIRLYRPSTGSVIQYKEELPQAYAPVYINEILPKSYPGWEIEATSILTP